MIRLQKILADAGVSSRRKAEEMILAGRVAVNGAVVRELGTKAGESDIVAVDGVRLNSPQQKIYLMLHKPEGVVTTVTDPQGRRTVTDLVPNTARLYPVGRLDYDTSGLILMTNDGDWAQVLTHPKHQVSKTYVATVRGTPSEDALRAFRAGLDIEGQRTAPCEVNVVAREATTKLSITLREGRNRQVRKMCEAIGHPVISLKRVAVGRLKLAALPRGQWRHLTASEVADCVKG